MIDKKPFRVTNEQAERELYCDDMDCVDCDMFDEKTCLHKPSDADYSADLLDARELIDKQEELIKEMRDQLSNIRSKFDASDVECNDAYIYVTNVNEIIAILEKTKEYAE